MMADIRRRSREFAAWIWNVRRLVLVCALLVAAGTSSSSQTRPSADLSPVDAAARALNAGRFDEVDALLRSSTDPRAPVLRARAATERGRYAEALMLLAGPASTSAGSDAALELGLLQMYVGRVADGKRTLERVLSTSPDRTAADLVRLGRAARALGQVQDANDYFRQASGLAPADLAMNLAWGELFLEKYNRQEAMKSFQAALAADQDNVAASIGLARVLLEDDPPAAKKVIDRVLAINPNYGPAHLAIAELALDNRKHDEARAAIRRALQTNPNGLEARSLEAAISFLEGASADFDAKVADIMTINPAYGEAYRVAGEQAARNYRFDEAVVLTRRALMVNNDNAKAYADLGMHLLRTGDESAARRALETAFKADPYDVVTYNSLELLDSLDKFVTITDGDIVMRLHPDEAAVMREYAMPLAKQALASLSKLWDFTPSGPILIEMFPKHDDFAVRTMGLPGLVGALGVCFGHVVTLDSPKARPPGQFNWQTTLWHELAHVITLQMSNNRVPRWLTEGISVWEEKRARPEWGREMEVAFAQALDAGKVLKVKDLNDGFTDPQLINLAYYEASLLVDHLAATYGEPAMRTLLRAYGKGLETDAALQEAYRVTVDQLQSSFDAKLDRDFAAIRRALKSPDVDSKASVDELKALAQTNAGSFAVQMRLGDALQQAGDTAAAIAAFERAAQLIPSATGEDNPNARIAAIALERKDTARAIQALDALVQVDHTDVQSARKLASLLEPTSDATRVTAAYERIVALDPFDSQAETMSGRMAMQRQDGERAIRAFRAALATAPADRAAAHVDLAEAYLMAGRQGDAKQQALAALEIAPSFERAQDVLLKLVDSSRGGGR